MSVRPPAVSGMFYPGSEAQIRAFFKQCANLHTSDFHSPNQNEDTIPRVLIVPHAGYVYSGCAAYQGFSLWQDYVSRIHTVVVIGPAHRVAFEGVTTVSTDGFQTPLGKVDLNLSLRDRLVEKFNFIHVSDMAHAEEHSIEVQIPFIQAILPNTRILPLLDGLVDSAKVAQLIEFLWDDPGVFFVISSDLSHFHQYEEANKIDTETASMINNAGWKMLNGQRACGYIGIQAILRLVQSHSLQVEQLALLNSADTAGDRDRVVGYGTWAVYERGR